MEEVETIEEISDEVVEEKKTLKEILVEMKDLSEAMTDLAYSSVLLNSKELAEEVMEIASIVPEPGLEEISPEGESAPLSEEEEEKLSVFRDFINELDLDDLEKN